MQSEKTNQNSRNNYFKRIISQYLNPTQNGGELPPLPNQFFLQTQELVSESFGLLDFILLLQ